jgi:hypothetical protein
MPFDVTGGLADGDSMSLARSAAALLCLFCGLAHAQQILKYEPDAQIRYDRIRGITSYWSDDVLLSEVGASMRLGFACPGDTGESPCVPSQVTLVFDNVIGHSIDYTKRELFILVGNDRFQGQMKVTYNTTLRVYSAEIPISLAILRQLAKSENVEMQVGSGQVTLSKEAIATIGSFYNMAVLNARQNTPAMRSKGQRRKS